MVDEHLYLKHEGGGVYMVVAEKGRPHGVARQPYMKGGGGVGKEYCTAALYYVVLPSNSRDNRVGI